MDKEYKNISDIVKNKLCIGCGGCVVNEEESFMIESKKYGIQIPPAAVYDHSSDICPGKGYPIIKMGQTLFPSNKYSLELGHYSSLFAATSMNQKIIKKATSGGIAMEITKYLFDNNFIKSAVTTKMNYSTGVPRPESYLATSVEEMFESQGSKYFSVSNLEVLNQLNSNNTPSLFIGTPCQIAGLRLLQKENKILKKYIKLTLGLFCGGLKPYEHTDKIIRRTSRGDLSKISYFQHRGDGQPGYMRINTINGDSFSVPYPDYETSSGHAKLRRCRLCVDATAELADISLGDFWIDKYLQSKKQWSVIISRNQMTDDLITDMKSSQLFNIKDASEDEIIQSQLMNLTSKKYRFSARSKAMKSFNVKTPDFDGGFKLTTKYNIFLEYKIILLYAFTSILEKIGLYVFFIDIYRRVFKTNKYRKVSWIKQK